MANSGIIITQPSSPPPFVMDSARLHIKETIHVYDADGKFKETRFVCFNNTTDQQFKHIVGDSVLIKKIELKDRQNAKGHN
jgi:hypothetical protein